MDEKEDTVVEIALKAVSEAVAAPPDGAAGGTAVGEKRGLLNEEKPKVVLHEVGYADKKQVEKVLKKAGIAFLKVKTTSHMSHAIVTFTDDAARDAALPRLQGLVIRGKAAVAEIAESRSLAAEGAPGPKRFRQDGPCGGNGSGRGAGGGSGGRGAGEGNGGRGFGGRSTGGRRAGGRGGRGDGRLLTIEERVTPLVHVPYEAQLKRKQKMLREDCCFRICREVRADWLKRFKEYAAQNPAAGGSVDDWLPEWLANVAQGRKARRQPTFQLDPIRASPQVRGYRNKCEFTIGRLRPDEPVGGQDKGGETNGLSCTSGDGGGDKRESGDASSGNGGGGGGGDSGVGNGGGCAAGAENCNTGGSSSGGPANASGGGSSGVGEVAVGFRLGSLNGSSRAAVGRPYGCRHVSDEMKAVSAAVEAVATASSLGAYDVLERSGAWRQLTLRQSWKTGQLMVHVMLQLLNDQERKIFHEKDLPLLIERLTGEGADKDWKAKGAALTAAAEAEAAKNAAAAAAAKAAAKAAEAAGAAAATAKGEEEAMAADKAVAGNGTATGAPIDGDAIPAEAQNREEAAAGAAPMDTTPLTASTAATQKEKAAVTDAAAAPINAASINGVSENSSSSSSTNGTAVAASSPSGASASDAIAAPAPAADLAAEAAAAAAVVGAAAAAAAGEAAAANRPRAHVASICLQEYNGSSVPDASDKVEVLWGIDHVEEELCGLRFRVGPGSFFQVNTPGAEVLYATILEHADMGGMLAEAAVLDVCCGTGTIGLACAKHGAASVTGVELCVPAVEDARRNAVANGISTATFVQDKAEKVMRGIITRVEAEMARVDAAAVAAVATAAKTQSEEAAASDGDGNVAASNDGSDAAQNGGAAPADMDVDKCANDGDIDGANSGTGPSEGGEVPAAANLAPAAVHASLAPATAAARGPALLAIVDPPRDGLHRDTIAALRQCAAITRLVYVSCNPTKSLPRDALVLCQPTSQRIRGEPFRPVRATGVDMFPHTEHAEMVMTFER